MYIKYALMSTGNKNQVRLQTIMIELAFNELVIRRICIWIKNIHYYCHEASGN